MPPIETVAIDDLNLRLKETARELKIPFEATLELTYACNLRCAHCYNPVHHAKPGELRGSEFRAVIDELAEAGCMLILFSGGEPLARPDVFELMEYSRRAGIQVVLNTNATLLDDAKIAKLNALAPTLLSVSVYGITAPTYESVTRVPGSFDQFLRGLSLIENYPHPVLFKMPVMTLNRHELEDARTWFRARGWRLIHSVEIHPRTDGDLSPLQVRLGAKEAAELRVRYGENTRCGGYNRGQDQAVGPAHRAFDCQCGKNSLAVTPYGEMNLCVSNPYPRYSLKTGSVREGWKLLVDFVENFQPSEKHECPRCELAPYCSQGSMDAWLNAEDFNPCLPYFRQVASLVREKVL